MMPMFDDAVLQPTPYPSRKVTAGTLAAAFTIIVVWVVRLFGTEIPGEVASAMTTVLGFIAAYMVPDRALQ